MKVISLVPSITETLVEAGVNVVGRTRFCIHPKDKTKDIAVVGGTKNLDWQKAKALKADFIILDKEENPKQFYDESPFEPLVIHVEDIKSCGNALQFLGEKLKNKTLSDYGERYLNLKPQAVDISDDLDWLSEKSDLREIEYIIWKKPWMAIAKPTYIASVFEYLGYQVSSHDEKYPKLDEINKEDKLYLFSSEPFPFRDHRDDLLGLRLKAAAIVEGEFFSWFGIRSLRYLEKKLST